MAIPVARQCLEESCRTPPRPGPPPPPLWFRHLDHGVELTQQHTCAELFDAAPEWTDPASSPPCSLFRLLMNLAEEQPEPLESLMNSLRGEETALARVRRIHRFWTETFPAALDLPFRQCASSSLRTLRDLYSHVS
jgi:hypothetical protein